MHLTKRVQSRIPTCKAFSPKASSMPWTRGFPKWPRGDRRGPCCLAGDRRSPVAAARAELRESHRPPVLLRRVCPRPRGSSPKRSRLPRVAEDPGRACAPLAVTLNLSDRASPAASA